MSQHRRNIYRVRMNTDTENFDGIEWIVDGEDGRRNYPGSWAECTAREYYHRGWNYDHERPVADVRSIAQHV